MDPKQAAIRQEAENSKYDQRVMAIDRVARVVKGGRRFRFRALVSLGDGKGQVGIGIAKGADVTSAITKAANVAKTNLQTVIIDNETIPHQVEAKVGGAKFLIMPAGRGAGMITGNIPRQILEVAGYKNIVAKSLGSSSKINAAYAVLAALDKLVAKDQWLNQPAKPKARSK